MIPRAAEKTLLKLAGGYPVVAITGPRQSGKTTIARATFKRKPYVSLEDPDQCEFAERDPRGFLVRFPDGLLLDEAQRCPSLFSYIQTIVDLDNRPGLFILTGSQQFGMLSNITQTLAGRVGLVQLLPFSFKELSKTGKVFRNLDNLLYKGLYPALYDRKVQPSDWYANYVMTYIERDVRQMMNIRELSTFQRFLRMCAARTGQLINLSGLANDCGITHNTARAWLSVLEASYIVFLLYPHYRNFGKRLVKTPKVYFYDTGLASWLINIQGPEHLSFHPMKGSLFESFVVSEMVKSRFNRGLTSNLFFWRDNTGNEIDVLIEQGETLIPVEIKSGQTVTPDYFSGIRKWMKFAGAPPIKPFLIYGGPNTYIREGIHICSWQHILV
ncbi:MAG: ATP-binding protein [Nitrospira sp.]|nr:ATP-binding protein [Nitrospira sp.]